MRTSSLKPSTSNMNDLRKKVSDALARLQRDPELARELEEKRPQAREEAEARISARIVAAKEDEIAEVAEPRLQAGLAATAGGIEDAQALMTETIVLRKGRPVLAIVNDEAKLDFRDAESEVWRQRLLDARAGLARAARAVGRIEVTRHPSFDWLGTGWLVAPETIVTNRHVAKEFGRQSGDKFLFRMGLGQMPMTASIDFLEEAERQERQEFRLRAILHIEDDDGPDLAFLAIEPSRTALAEALTLATGAVVTGQQVAVIGYPARDSRILDQNLMTEIFGDVYDKKRLAPGEIMSAEDNSVEHDCSTLGG